MIFNNPSGVRILDERPHTPLSGISHTTTTHAFITDCPISDHPGDKDRYWFGPNFGGITFWCNRHSTNHVCTLCLIRTCEVMYATIQSEDEYLQN